MKKIKSGLAVDIMFWAVGAFIYAAAVTLFIEPNEISPGGFTGIAVIFHRLLGISSGTVLFLLNIPLIILQYKKFGGGFIVKTAAATFLVSFFLNVTESYLPSIKVDGILAAVFGGILSGLGLSLVLLRGATTGGVDVIAKFINQKYPHISVGRVILFFDFFVVVLTALIYGNIESALYSLFAIFSTSRIIDAVLYGADRGKMVLAITENGAEISQFIIKNMSRGVTILKATGAYTNMDKSVLLCAVRIHEVSELRKIILQHDKKAFILVTDVGEIIGEGFKIG